MPVQLTYPGVYIEEIPSGVRTIMGVSTSITAFIGRAKKGKPDTPSLISSYSDYERMFGGLWVESTMSYAVRDFFLNGGSQAIIIRVVHNGKKVDDTSDATKTAAKAAEITVSAIGGSPAGNLILSAASPGKWGNDLTVELSFIPPLLPPASPPASDTKFNLKVLYKGNQVELHLNVNLDPNDAKYLPNVLANRSGYLLATTIPLNGQISFGTYSATQGDDGSEPEPHHYIGKKNDQTGLNALYKTDIFNLLCIPPPARSKNTDKSVYAEGLKICVKQRAMLLVDPPVEWGDVSAGPIAVNNASGGLGSLNLNGDITRNAILYFPLLIQSDPYKDGQLDTFVPCGTAAGIMAKTDATRGVWKSAAGQDAGINGARGLQINLNDSENGSLNILGINCLRTFPVTGTVVWGARTMRGADQLADEYKYACVRRTALFIEESLYRGTQWVVFEPNDEPLWSQIRLNIGSFMHNLFRQGAFQGKTPREAYLVKCDKETTTQNDINMGVVNILVGFAPLKPAEFVIINIQQLAGQIES
jgi:uncharacterized protein